MMNREFYSDKEFREIKERLNKEILRRSTFKWWDPLAKPTVGQDKSSPLSLPDNMERVYVDDKTYTINTPSTGSIEPTRNIYYPAQGDNPGGPRDISNTSASQLNVDEIKNFLVGLAKINDINLFYGRDEIEHLAFRDPNGIEDLLDKAESDRLNLLLKYSDISPTKIDPNGGEKQYKTDGSPIQTIYPMENGQYIMPSGEYDGEEISEQDGLGPHNFFDDYGAPAGYADYHPYNRAITPIVRRDRNDQGDKRNELPTKVRIGGTPAANFGRNPRNPVQGKQFPSRPVYGGTKGTCNNACTGLCYITCDNECSEGCTTTCWGRCGEACTSSCGNVCTGCSTLCYTSCRTGCQNTTGYSCVNAGAKTVKPEGISGTIGKNVLNATFHKCNGCSFSCQFYPNKKTECWDSGCMGRCFTACNTGCSTSCLGACVDNTPRIGNDYKTGVGRGCQSNCTLNCIGICEATCVGNCVSTCYQTCNQECSDNCAMTCSSACSSGCANKCSRGCTGCTSCSGSCEGQSVTRGCIGCGHDAGCTSTCRHDCNTNCIGFGCRSICGSDNIGACENNCRFNCMNSSCTAMCSDACASTCTSCVNTCDMSCGSCSGQCTVGCTQECNVTCTENCQHTCDLNCVTSCTDGCNGCSNLCYSCIGMCIGICSVRCQSGCSSCSNNCGWWCDTACSRACLANCTDYCINTCIGSCITMLHSEAKSALQGPVRTPTSDGYIYKYPKNRWEERESFKIIRDINRPTIYEEYHWIIKIDFDEERNIRVTKPDDLEYFIRQSSINGGVYSINEETGEWEFNEAMFYEIVPENEANFNGGNGLFLIEIPLGTINEDQKENQDTSDEDYTEINEVYEVTDKIPHNTHNQSFNNTILEGEDKLIIEKTNESDYTLTDELYSVTKKIVNNIHNRAFNDTMVEGETAKEIRSVVEYDDYSRISGVFKVTNKVIGNIIAGSYNRTSRTDITDADILVRVPFGFVVHPYIWTTTSVIVVIERDTFLLHGWGGLDHNEGFEDN